MAHLQLSVDKFLSILKKCQVKKNLAYAKRVYEHMCKNGVESHSVVGNYMVPIFVECGGVAEAHLVFNKLVHRNERSWTSLILGYVHFGQTQHALNLYQKMQENYVHPSRYTHMALLKACAKLKDAERGRKIHAEIAQKGFEKDIFVGTTLVDMYAKCGSLVEAREVFDKLLARNVVSWNALISGYAEYGGGQEALNCFEQMQLEGISPDAVTLVSILKACGNIGAISKAREIHFEIAEKGFERDVFVDSTLIDMYIKCGSLIDARNVFDKMPVRNAVTWNTLLAGYAEHGFSQETVSSFDQMQLEGVSADAVSYICVLKACGCLGAIGKGREIHAEAAQKGFERDYFVCSTLVDMYAKCGSLLEAQEVFNKLPLRNAVSWNAIIKGYGMNHEGNVAVKCFEDMQSEGVMPDAFTFTSLLTACNHMNLTFEGQRYFQMMRAEFGIAPTKYHFTCMVDLLAQSGHLYEAERFVETMQCPPSEEIWKALLSACKTYGEADLGSRCFQQLVQLNPDSAAAYVLMANIYANDGRQEDAYRVEELRKLAGVYKKPASALIEVNEKVHEFVVGNQQGKEISEMLEGLGSRAKGKGHMPNVDLVVRQRSFHEKEAALCEHAERLAIAFGLLNTPQGQTLRVTKNLRMCSDCHNASKIISRIEMREIIIRDTCCVHHFKNGLCSCADML